MACTWPWGTSRTWRYAGAGAACEFRGCPGPWADTPTYETPAHNRASHRTTTDVDVILRCDMIWLLSNRAPAFSETAGATIAREARAAPPRRARGRGSDGPTADSGRPGLSCRAPGGDARRCTAAERRRSAPAVAGGWARPAWSPAA